MAYPAGVTTRTISLGPGLILEDGTELAISATVKASADLVWSETGTSLRTVARTIPASAVGDEPTLVLPITDQVGWIRNGDPLDVTEGQQTHTYTATLVYSDADGIVVSATAIGPFALPLDDGSPLDIDKLIQAPITTGVTLAIPDAWSQSVAAAEAAVAAIPDTIEQALEDHTPGITLGYAERVTPYTPTAGGTIPSLSVVVVGTGRPVDIEAQVTKGYHSAASAPLTFALQSNGVTVASDEGNSYSTTTGRAFRARRQNTILTNGVTYTFTILVAHGLAGTMTWFADAERRTTITVTSR